WFGSSSSTAAAAPVAAAPAAATPVLATSAQVYTSVVTQPPAAAPAAVPTTSAAPVLSDSNPYVGGDLFSLLFGSSSSPTSAAAAAPAAPAVQSAAAGGYASPAATGASNPIHGSGSGSGSGTESGYTFSTSIVTGSTLGKSFQGGGTATGSVNQATVTVSGSSAGATAGVGAKGITYSPYTDQDNCKSADQVARDIKLLSNYDVIRLYSTDCQGIENVLAAMNSNQQIYLGVWNIESPMGELQDIVNAISQNSRGWSAVHTIAIGNERVNSGEATVAQVQQAVDTARQFLKSNSYTGPIVTVDTLVAYVANPQLCQMSDYLAVNCHPYWDGGVQPSNSGPWLLQQIANLQSVCGTEKDVLITESGWPTQGDPYGQCVPSVPNQVAAVKSIVSSLADRVILFTMYNDYWKFSIGGAGPYGVEYYWGLFGNSPE
ncbi:SCW/CMP-family cell wall glucosidase, putative, partial [Candida maltosa Xu316]